MKKIEPITDPKAVKSSILLFKQGALSLEDWHVLTQGLYSKNSLLSFQNDWQVFVEYCREVNVCPLPAAVTAVRRFIEAKSTLRKASSIKRYIITVSMMHRVHGLSDPTRHREVRFTLNKLYQEKADEADQATAFHYHHLQSLHSKLCTSDRLKDIRDLLIWTLCFECMLKRSELAAIQFEDIIKTEYGFTLQISDTSMALSPEASALIELWFEMTAITDGPLLRRINKHQQLGDAPMDHSSIYRVFRRAAEELGVQGTLTFSGQSPRVGASQDLSDSGLTIKEIQQQGRWKSPAMPAQYVGNKQARDEAMDKFKRKLDKD
ncbi:MULTISPECIES: tyrosine-type recombinase/integrase [Grimontia]|uniref:Phage integrase family protein n=1 Tax=Grimontia marina TaxID=646534 RepID=A0A128F309_9GAMM|nr:MULTISPECIES: tyrosine-type recombinase/integrase [Grimontia]WRW00029.1 tyrosine-type recombinase/integrase [Grimontia sp. NTOU-MAR1]CZF80935.1 Phage integrase family protein [Grimontia marina]